MKFSINLKPFPAEPYFTVREHLLKFSPDLEITGLKAGVEKNLRNLFGIPSGYAFTLLNCSEKEKFLMNFDDVQLKDSPDTGIDIFACGHSALSGKNLLDLSYSFPQVTDEIQIYDLLMIDPNMSLGIPCSCFVVFYKADLPDISEYMLIPNEKDLYLFSSVLDDLKIKGIDQLLIESNYKSAVLYNALDLNPKFDLVQTKDSRSKTMIFADTSRETVKKIFDMGYEIDHHEFADAARVTIANYSTHSKELIEMFTDRIDAL